MRVCEPLHSPVGKERQRQASRGELALQYTELMTMADLISYMRKYNETDKTMEMI